MAAPAYAAEPPRPPEASIPNAAATTTAAGEAGALTILRPTQWSAARLIGSDLHDLTGREVGDVSDLVIERDGRVSHLLVAVGGTLFGIGGHLVAIPMPQVLIGADDKLTVNLTRQQLLNAPAFRYTSSPLPSPTGVGAGTAGAGATTPSGTLAPGERTR